MPAKSKCIAFSHPPPKKKKKKKKIIKPYDFTEQICLDFTEQTQKKKKNPTSIPNKYPKAQPNCILKKKKKPVRIHVCLNHQMVKPKQNLKPETLKKKTSSRTMPYASA